METQKPDFYVRRVAVFNKALTDKQLQRLTDPQPWWKTLLRTLWPWSR